MTDQARAHDFYGSLERTASERARAERYQRYQRRIRSGLGHVAEGPRPREFDESGFPVPQRSPTFVERVARLLNPL
jgi:hypothetical protein